MIRPRILGAGCDKHLGTEHFWCCDAANTAAMYVALSTRLEPRNSLSVAAGSNPLSQPPPSTCRAMRSAHWWALSLVA